MQGRGGRDRRDSDVGWKGKAEGRQRVNHGTRKAERLKRDSGEENQDAYETREGVGGRK